MTTMKVAFCKEAGIRKNPSCSQEADEIVGIVKRSDEILVDTSMRYMSWDDKEFYACQTPVGDGYILTDLVTTRGRRRKTNGR